MHAVNVDIGTNIEQPEPLIAKPKERSRWIGEYYFSGHALDQMKKRGVSLENVRGILEYGKSYPSGTQGREIYVRPDKNIGVVVNPDRNIVVTVIDFKNQNNLAKKLSKVEDAIEERVFEDFDEEYDNEEALIKKFGLFKYVYGE